MGYIKDALAKGPQQRPGHAAAHPESADLEAPASGVNDTEPSPTHDQAPPEQGPATGTEDSYPRLTDQPSPPVEQNESCPDDAQSEPTSPSGAIAATDDPQAIEQGIEEAHDPPDDAGDEWLDPDPTGLDIEACEHGAIDDRLVVLTEPSSIMAEEYRSIRTSILARWEQKRHLVHTITSATPQEGKTITSLNLGLSFAELRNRQTLVIEADLRLPQFESQLGLDRGTGLVPLLDGQVTLEDVIVTVPDTNLHVIPAGKRANDRAVQLLSSTPMAELLERLRESYDHVIIDTPPVVELADAGILGAMSDDVLLIARLQRTPQSLIEQAIRTLGSYNADVAGLIATDHKHRRHGYYYKYGYRYSYRYYQKSA